MSQVDGVVSGAYALARGAIDAGVSLVSGYAGSPTTSVVNEILAQSQASDIQVEWTTNEKVALDGLWRFTCRQPVGAVRQERGTRYCAGPLKFF